MRNGNSPRSVPRRAVKDVASHLLDGSLSAAIDAERRVLSGGWFKSSTERMKVLWIFWNRLNDEWEIGTRRIVPVTLDPQGPAIFSVGWASEDKSENWMDIARDFTEKWHHTQQIFEATNRSSTIMDRRLGYPCLDIFMRALPFTFRNVEADIGSLVTVTVTGEVGGTWHVEKKALGWQSDR